MIHHMVSGIEPRKKLIILWNRLVECLKEDTKEEPVKRFKEGENVVFAIGEEDKGRDEF